MVKQRIRKNVELLSSLATFFDSEMDEGEKIRMTRLSKSIVLSNQSHPHVSTVRQKCTELSVIQEVLSKLKFHFENNELVEIEKITSNEDSVKRGIKKALEPINKKIEDLEKIISERIPKKHE